MYMTGKGVLKIPPGDDKLNTAVCNTDTIGLYCLQFLVLEGNRDKLNQEPADRKLREQPE